MEVQFPSLSPSVPSNGGGCCRATCFKCVCDGDPRRTAPECSSNPHWLSVWCHSAPIEDCVCGACTRRKFDSRNAFQGTARGPHCHTCFSQNISHVLLVKHTRHCFVAPLPEAPLLACQQWGQVPVRTGDWRLPQREAPSPAVVAPQSRSFQSVGTSVRTRTSGTRRLLVSTTLHVRSQSAVGRRQEFEPTRGPHGTREDQETADFHDMMKHPRQPTLRGSFGECWRPFVPQS